jgi:hypothetical protein
MVTHVVLFRFRSDLPAGSVEAVFEKLRGFRQSIPGITSFQGGAYHSPEGLSLPPAGSMALFAWLLTLRPVAAVRDYAP